MILEYGPLYLHQLYMGIHRLTIMASDRGLKRLFYNSEIGVLNLFLLIRSFEFIYLLDKYVLFYFVYRR